MFKVPNYFIIWICFWFWMTFWVFSRVIFSVWIVCEIIRLSRKAFSTLFLSWSWICFYPKGRRIYLEIFWGAFKIWPQKHFGFAPRFLRFWASLGRSWKSGPAFWDKCLSTAFGQSCPDLGSRAVEVVPLHLSFWNFKKAHSRIFWKNRLYFS